MPLALFAFFIEKGETVIVLNKMHNTSLDFFFSYYTFLGSGWVIVVLAGICFFIRFRFTVCLALIGVLQALAMLIFKVILFPNAPRPVTYLQDVYPLSLVEGVAPLLYRSFPSGHTMTAFGVAAFLACFSSAWHHRLLLLIYASLVGFSRIYLSLHFLTDVLVGSLLGLGLTIVGMRMTGSSLLSNLPLERRIKS